MDLSRAPCPTLSDQAVSAPTGPRGAKTSFREGGSGGGQMEDPAKVPYSRINIVEFFWFFFFLSLGEAKVLREA